MSADYTEIDNEIAQVEGGIKQGKEAIELAKAARRLYDNKDFKKLVIEDFFEGEAIRLAHLYSDPAMDAEQREAIRIDIMSIGFLQRYFRAIVQFGNAAEQSAIADSTTLDELHAERAAMANAVVSGETGDQG